MPLNIIASIDRFLACFSKPTSIRDSITCDNTIGDTLIKSSYTPFKKGHICGEIEFKMNLRKAKEIQDIVEKSDLNNDLTLTTILQRFRGQFHSEIVIKRIDKISLVA